MSTLKKRLKACLRELLMTFRYKRGLTQAQMSGLLHISERSYSNLECGRYCFSTVTLICFVILFSDDELLEIIHSIKALIEDMEKKEAA